MYKWISSVLHIEMISMRGITFLPCIPHACLYYSVLVLSLFCRDGTSIILSDDVGQLYILSTGQGESQQDAKYDQVLEFINILSISALLPS